MTAPQFRISSFCVSGECVAVAFLPRQRLVLVRHDRGGEGSAAVEFTYAEFGAFLAGVRAGEFDLPTMDVAR